MSFRSNILSVWHASNAAERQTGERWYADAAELCRRLGKQYDVPATTVAGVLSALSPRNRWEANCEDAENVLFAFTNGASRRYVTVRTFKSNLRKAWAMLKDDSPLSYLGGFKTLNFFRNLCGDADSVTVDSHAATLAWNGLRKRLIAPRVSELCYARMAEAYREAAASVDVSPCVMQATCWTTYRNHWSI